MKLADRLRIALRQMAHDLLGEDEPFISAPELDELSQWTGEMRSQLRALRSQYDQALAREKQAQLVWQQALGESIERQAKVDAALSAGQDEIARELIDQLNRQQKQVKDLEKRFRSFAQVSSWLADEMQVMQKKVDNLQTELADLEQRERSAQAVDQLEQLHRQMRREMRELQEGLALRQEKIARLEDQQAARREFNKRSLP